MSWSRTSLTIAIVAILLAAIGTTGVAGETAIGDHTFTLADGFTIEQIAGPPLVDRPICADFDEQGRLYVADSSGSNDKVEIQLEEKPHRIVRLEDTDGDGDFDARTVFADRMMFPEGALWYDGSLYVAAPPVIWKLTDTDDDGVADEREPWFDGKTLTGCANDLHGPYLGPDGWIYWCKGAFAEQTYERPGREPFVTRAAHIFRRRPEGGPIEPVMAGGMDNPVEVAFTPGGERIFSTTFLQRPGNGLRDGLIHALYGGVYGKVNGVLEGHPRTGELLPPLSHLGPAAPCGLVCLQSDQLGGDYQGNLLTCLFNMHRLTRHVLTPKGATFESQDEDFLVSDNIDFHPTDVMEDADGSLIVIDTGGWYKLCCPTSNLWKPDIYGAIYRVRRTGSHQIDDPRGDGIAWSKAGNVQLAALLDDDRIAVRSRSGKELRTRGGDAVAALKAVLENSDSSRQRLNAAWTLTSIDTPSAREAARVALTDEDETVRQAALHSVSVWRDQGTSADLLRLLQTGTPHNRRAAAEALGRLGHSDAVESLLEAAAEAPDRALEHSLIYALIEIGDVEQIREALADASPSALRAALIALDQMPHGDLQANEVVPHLRSDDSKLGETAWWIAGHHGEWAGDLVETFRAELASPQPDEGSLLLLTSRLSPFADNSEIQSLIAESVARPSTAPETRIALLNAMATAGVEGLPDVWSGALIELLEGTNDELCNAAVSTISTLSRGNLSEDLAIALHAISLDTARPAETRLQAISALPEGSRSLDDPQMLQFLCSSFAADQPIAVRMTAVDVLAKSPLDTAQLLAIADAIPQAGPMELTRLVERFSTSNDEAVGQRLVHRLSQSPVVTSLPLDRLKIIVAAYGPSIAGDAEPLFARILQDNRARYDQLEAILALLDDGDIRRGQRVFHNAKVACIACHTMGYLGGRVGPDLTRIGRIRSERDLLEAILFPSASFVRSYEPTTLLLADGRVLNGVIREESSSEITLQLDAQKSAQIPLSDIEERQPGTVSVMPTGLDKQLTPQQLADLVTFLKSAQ